MVTAETVQEIPFLYSIVFRTDDFAYSKAHHGLADA
jgi:hypothetical protein